MPLTTLNADHVGQVGGGFEPQRPNNVQMYIVGLAGNENDLISLSLSSFPIPKSNLGIMEIGYLNQTRKFAGKPTYDDLSVVFRDYCDQNTKTVLANWFYLSHNPVNGKTSFASQYKKNGRIVLYGPDGTHEREWEIQGVWMSAFDPGDADMETGDDSLRITCTFTIDKAIYKPSSIAA